MHNCSITCCYSDSERGHVQHATGVTLVCFAEATGTPAKQPLSHVPSMAPARQPFCLIKGKSFFAWFFLQSPSHRA
eukprot:1158103-Pelagomonas_calceolata.AAC.10